MKLENIGKIFMIGDLHYGVRNNSVVWKDDMFDFMEKFLDNLPSHGFNRETDILMLTGDVFHSREFLNVMIGNKVLELFSRVTATFKRGVLVILGNHDVYYKRNNAVHTLKFIEKAFPNFAVFTEPHVLNINGKHKFLMLPWHDEVEELDKAITENESCDYLFCHMEIEGFKYNKAIRVDKGMMTERLNGFKRIYAGHLHHKQESGNVLYLGSPYQMDFGDMDTPRGYYVITVAGDMLHEEYFENEWSPRFVSCLFEDMMNMTFEDAAKLLNKNYAYVHIPTSASRNFAFNMFVETMQSRGITPRRLEFKQYDDSYKIDEAQFAATSDFNLATAAKALLEEKKYSHAETEGILTYFNNLYTLAKNNEKETVKNGQ